MADVRINLKITAAGFVLSVAGCGDCGPERVAEVPEDLGLRLKRAGQHARQDRIANIGAGLGAPYEPAASIEPVSFGGGL